MDPRVRLVIALVEKSGTPSYTICELANLVHLSPSRLNCIFKHETGYSFSHYMKIQRLHHAKCLLETTFLSVKEVMRLVGICDISHFVRDFKKLSGLTPSEYRARHLQSDTILHNFERQRANQPMNARAGKQTS